MARSTRLITVGSIALCGYGIVLALLWANALNVALSAQQSQAPAAIDWTGTYAVEGSSPTGPYTARLDIGRHGEVYEVQWTFPQGDMMFGVGFVYNGDLVVGYTAGSPGVIVYHVVERTPLTLEGRWTGWGFDRVSPERAVKGQPAIRAGR